MKLPPISAVSRTLESRHRQEWRILVLVLVLLVGAVAYVLWLEHGRNRAQEQGHLQTQSRIIEENLVRQLQGANSALAGVRYDLLYGDHEFDSKNLQLHLQLLSNAMPGVRTLAVLDKTGYVVTANRNTLTGKDFHERAYFAVPAEQKDYTALYVSPPFLASTGVFVMSLSKAMAGTDNQFAGVVTATLDPEYFDIVMRSVLYAPDMAASISHGDGRVFLVAPANPAALDMDLNTAGSVFRQYLASGKPVGFFSGPSPIHGDERMQALRNIQPPDMRMDKPLTIAVSRSLAAVDAPWFAQLRAYTGVLGLLVLGSCLSLGYVHNRRLAMKNANDAAQRALRETAQRFEFGLKGADLGLWDWNLVHNKLTINDRQWQMLGYSPNEVELSSGFWQGLLHPEDVPVLRAAFLAHIKGETTGYQLEHRMRHKDGRWLWVLDHAMVMERDAQGRAMRLLGTHLDITERKRADTELAAATALLRRTGEIAKIGGWQLEPASMQLTWTDEVFRIHGLPIGPTPALNESLREYTPQARAQLEAAIQNAIATGAAWSLELEMSTASGQDVWVRSRGETVWQDGKAVRLIGTLQDITERMRFQLELQDANQQLARLSVTDGLTNVGNRRKFDQSLAAEWARSSRQQQPLALLMIDIDYFKRYNDSYGHQGGDACLRAVARILSACLCRPGEQLVRYGGEEFAVLLLNTDTAGASVVAQRCLDRMRQAALPHTSSPVSDHVSLSIGVASSIPAPGQSADDLVAQADAALYQAKHQGRARYACAPPPAPQQPATT